MAKAHNKATPTRFPTIISLTRINITDLPTILGTVFPNLSSSIRRCSSLVLLGLPPVPPPPNKPQQTSNTLTRIVRTSTLSSTLQTRTMTLDITISIRTLEAPFQEMTTSYTEIPVYKAS